MPCSNALRHRPEASTYSSLVGRVGVGSESEEQPSKSDAATHSFAQGASDRVGFETRAITGEVCKVVFTPRWAPCTFQAESGCDGRDWCGACTHWRRATSSAMRLP